MAWNNNIVDELKRQINIIDEIGKFVNLKKTGSNYKGLCPFHSEKTPSFSVSEEKQVFYCFGCGAKGDVIRFIELYDKIPFLEAVEKLCDQHGIKKQGISANKNYEDYEKYYKINAITARFFYNSLGINGNEGLKYLHSRQIKNETINKWGLGYAPNSGNALVAELRKHNVSDEDILKIGLAYRNKNGKLYDRFINRVIFPIFNTRDKIIGFGGRAIGDAMPKYLNSPESSIFLKKNNLFGLNFTKNDISSSDKVIVTEGYMDVISLWQNGIKNVVASLGTALTDNQASLITRYTKNVVLSYDSDDAGVKAAFRGIDIMSKASAKVRVLSIPEGKDPDEYVKRFGKSSFQQLVENSIYGTDFKLNFLKKGYDFSDSMQVGDYIDKIIPILKELPPHYQDIYINKVADEFKISNSAIKLSLNNEKKVSNRKTNINTKTENIDSKKIDYFILLLLARNFEYYQRVKDDNINLTSSVAKKVFLAIEKEIDNNNINDYKIDINGILELLEPDEEAEFINFYKSTKIGSDEETFYNDVKKNYKLNELRLKRIELKNELSLAETFKDSEKIKKLTLKIRGIDLKIEHIYEEA